MPSKCKMWSCGISDWVSNKPLSIIDEREIKIIVIPFCQSWYLHHLSKGKSGFQQKICPTFDRRFVFPMVVCNVSVFSILESLWGTSFLCLAPLQPNTRREDLHMKGIGYFASSVDKYIRACIHCASHRWASSFSPWEGVHFFSARGGSI